MTVCFDIQYTHMVWGATKSFHSLVPLVQLSPLVISRLKASLQIALEFAFYLYYFEQLQLRTFCIMHNVDI